MRYRKGSKGLYYTDNKLDNCYYNEYHCNIIQLYSLYLRQNLSRLNGAIKSLLEALGAILFLSLFFILPVIQIVIRKMNMHKYLTPKQLESLKVKPDFTKDYFEEVS